MADSGKNSGFRQSMAWLHTWVGLIPGWLLYAVFLFGTAAFFRAEIDTWMRPELPAAAVTPRAIDAADTLLRERGAGAESWSVSFPDARGGDGLVVSWRMPEQAWKDIERITLDPVTGREVAVRETRGGFFLYRFHFDLHYMPVMWARYLVSIAALAMLIAILSGVVTHKKILTDFFLLRFGKGQRSWLDSHNVMGVLALPFHLMITYTGLVTLLFTLMPWAITANYPSTDAYYEAAFPRAPEVEPEGKPKAMLPLSDLTARARAAWGGLEPGHINIRYPNDAVSITEIYASGDRLGARIPPVTLDSGTGVPANVDRSDRGGARATQDVMIQLHRGGFAGTGLRWLYFLSGVGGTLMIATGLILWTVKRRARLPDPARPHFGFRLVERLNIGFIVGAPTGIAVYFLANRLLPLTTAERADWEINSLFIAWGAVFVWAIARPAKRAWVEVLGICAVLYALVPVVDAATTPRWLIPSLLAGDWVMTGFDLTMLATAAACAFAAWKVANHKGKAPSRRRTAADRLEIAA